MIEAVRTSETSVHFNEATLRYNTESFVFILAAVRTDISHRRVLLFTINARPWSTTSVRSMGFRKETFTLEIVMADE
jgi:hypothetical protein